jgi:hypothetical protein
MNMREFPGRPGTSGSYTDPFPVISGWCSRVSGILSDALVKASIIDSDYNDLVTSERLLRRVLELIKLSLTITPNIGYDGPFTRRLVERALAIHQALQTQTQEGEDEITVENRYHFLRSYITFAQVAIENFDKNDFNRYSFDYLPCENGVSYARCPVAGAPAAGPIVGVPIGGAPAVGGPMVPGFDFPSFQKKYEEFANSELWFALGPDVVLLAEQYGVLSTVPVDERMSLRIAEYVARHVAEDLTRLANHSQYYCAIEKLTDLAEELKGFNHATGSILSTGRRALQLFQTVYKNASRDLHQIPCEMVPHPLVK